MGKIYTIEVGVEYPQVEAEDTLEVQVEFTDEELKEIIQGGIRLMHNDSMDIGTYDFIEVLSKSAYSKLNALAENIASEKWGEKMLVSNGAKYIYFLPEDISDAIFDSDEAREIETKRKASSDQSAAQFHDDSRTLFDNHAKGRWQNRLLPDPHWNNAPFGGIWNGSPVGSFKDNYSKYGFHCTIELDGKKTEISYSVKYLPESYELELRVFEYNENVVRIFENTLTQEGYSIKERRPIGEPVYSYVIYAEGNDPKTFVSTYMNILDQVIRLYNE